MNLGPKADLLSVCYYTCSDFSNVVIRLLYTVNNRITLCSSVHMDRPNAVDMVVIVHDLNPTLHRAFIFLDDRCLVFLCAVKDQRRKNVLCCLSAGPLHDEFYYILYISIM